MRTNVTIFSLDHKDRQYITVTPDPDDFSVKSFCNRDSGTMNPDHFDKEDLIKCGHGKLFPGATRLPIDEMLMVDRVTHVGTDDGLYGKGSLIAELDINPDLWFLKCISWMTPSCPAALAWTPCGSLWAFTWPGAAAKAKAAHWAPEK